jgi:hypothetical protein
MPTETKIEPAEHPRCHECGHPVGVGHREGLPHRDHEAHCSQGICKGCGSVTTHYIGCPLATVS